jgi:hypothetical protein
MRFYLDEMFSPRIAAIARAQGSDVTSSHESGQDSTTDDVQLHNGLPPYTIVWLSPAPP